MKKSLEISAKFDTSDFDRSVADMQRKLKDLATPADLTKAMAQTAARLTQAGIGVTGPSQIVQERAAIQHRKDLIAYSKDEYRKQEELSKQVYEKNDSLKKLLDKQAILTKGSKEYLEIEKQITQVEKNRNDIKQKALEAGIRATNAAHDIIQPSGGNFWKTTGKISNTVGEVGGAALVIGKVMERLAGEPMRLESAKATAIKQTTGQDLSQIYAGRAPFEAAYMPERGKASAIATEKSDTMRVVDTVKALGGVAALVGAVVATWASGGTLGAAILGAGGLGELMTDRTRERALSYLPNALGGREHGEKYEQLLAAERAKDFRQVLEDLKDQDPQKKLTIEDFEKNYQRNVQSQRTLGLSNKGFYGQGGFLQRSAEAGFTAESAIQMGQQIVGAGGSARTGNQAQFGLQMQRSGITNAAQVLGNLGGSMQSPDASKQAVINILSEAFKIGLDNSDYVEETRRFTQTASEMISKTGAVRGEDQDRIASMLGMFVGEKTVSGIGNAKTANEEFQQRGSQTGGRRGVMRFAEARRDPNLGRLETQDLVELLAMRPEELESNPAVLSYFSKQAGISPDQLMQKMGNIQKSTRFQIPRVKQRTEQFSSTIKKYMEAQHMDLPELARRSREGILPSDIQQAIGGMQVGLNIEEQGGLTQSLALARMGEGLTGRKNLTEKEKEATKKLLQEPSGRIEDDFTKAIAESADLVRQNFNKLNTELIDAISNTKAFSETVGGAASRRGTATPGGVNNPLGNILKAARQSQADRARK